MKRKILSSIASFTSFTFLTVVLFCCCLSAEAGVAAAPSAPSQVEQAQPDQHSHCHSHAAKSDPRSTPSHECQCGKIAGVAEGAIVDRMVLAASTSFPISLPLYTAESRLGIAHIVATGMSHPPPQREKTALPLYIEFSVLRI